MPSYVMRDGTMPAVGIYTRCEDELLCRAELLRLLSWMSSEEDGKRVIGLYDVDPTFTIGEFKRAYRGRHRDYQRLMDARSKIIAEGWPYAEFHNDEEEKNVQS